MCHAWVKWLVRRDVSGRLFLYAPLGGPTFLSSVPPEIQPTLPDSIVVLTTDYQVLTRSRATLYLVKSLSFPWSVFYCLGIPWPIKLLDFFYDRVASIRKKIFATPKSVCPILPAHLRKRFLPYTNHFNYA
jgi:predicted DCC family thiol-disulfide oxidoreductase YuxK